MQQEKMSLDLIYVLEGSRNQVEQHFLMWRFLNQVLWNMLN